MNSMKCGRIMHLGIALMLSMVVTLAKTSNDMKWVAIAKDCNIQGQSIGRLEWQVFPRDDQIVLRCDIIHAPTKLLPQLNFVIAWTNREGTKPSYNTIGACNSMSEDTEISDDSFHCEHNVTIPRLNPEELSSNYPNSNLTCWVKTFNSWNSENKTWCSSDEISVMDVLKDAIMLDSSEKKTPSLLLHYLYPSSMPGHTLYVNNKMENLEYPRSERNRLKNDGSKLPYKKLCCCDHHVKKRRLHLDGTQLLIMGAGVTATIAALGFIATAIYYKMVVTEKAIQEDVCACHELQHPEL